MEGGMVAVDRWSEGSQAYFPTHLHADHASGLSSSWNKDPLFCSRTTTKLHPFQLPDFDVSLFRAADVGSCYSLSLHSPSTGSPSLVQFMSIDALHCPGKAYRSTIYSELRCLKLYMLSNDMCEVVFDLIAQPTCFVMFLFRGDFGHVLYTGDFRWEAADDKAQKGRTMLLDALNGASVDVLHLDNTYCNPLYSIPSRDDATQQVMDIITSHPNYDIIIGINNLGKEQLLTHISCTLKIKKACKLCTFLVLHDVFTTKTSATRVQAVPRYSYTVDTVEGLIRTLRPTIGIMPFGLPWIVRPQEEKQSDLVINGTNGTDRYYRLVEKIDEYMYTVPYSDHSCYSKIEEFVQLVKPMHIKGMVSISSCYVDPITT